MSEISDFYALWRTLKTIYEMCSDRGYMVSHLLLDETLAEFKEKHNNILPPRKDLFSTFTHSCHPDDQICTILNEEPLNNTEVRAMMSRMQENSLIRAIVVICNDIKVTPAARKMMDEAAPAFFFDFYLQNELLVNITHHELVPEHHVLSLDEGQQVLQAFRARQSQLPRMLKTDPICRYYGMRPGQIVKIIRKSETAGIYVTYRIVY